MFNPKLIDVELDSLTLQDNVCNSANSVGGLAPDLNTLGQINPIIAISEKGRKRVEPGRRIVQAV